MRRVAWLFVVALVAGGIAPATATERGLAEQLEALEAGPTDTRALRQRAAQVCAATSVSDDTEGGPLDVETYAGAWSCTGNELVFTLQTADSWTQDQLFELYVLMDTDGDPTNGCNEGDFLAYGVNQPDDTDEQGNPTDEVLAGIFRTPSCDRDDFETVGLAQVVRDDDRSVTIVFGRSLVGNPATVRHYGGLAAQGESDDSADYVPDEGGIQLQTAALPETGSAPLCIPDETDDVVTREEGEETPADQPGVDLTEACLYYGDEVRLEVTLPALDLAELGAGAGPAALVDLDGDGAADRLIRGIWNGLGFLAEVTDTQGTPVCRGRVLITRDVWAVGDLESGCLDDAPQVSSIITMGALASASSVYLDRAGDGTLLPFSKAGPIDPGRLGTDPQSVEVPDPAERPQDNGLVRLAGPARIETSVEVSRNGWPEGAAAVVLARQDVEADALAGAPLATAVRGPLLLTPSFGLTKAVANELRRVLQPGGRVYILGGTAALSDDVIAQVQQLGFGTVRLAGQTRLETGLAIAQEASGFLEQVQQILIADAFDFEWALMAGAAAGATQGVVLTTAAAGLSEGAQAFIDAHPAAPLTAVGPAAVQAAPEARGLNGSDAYDTSVIVAGEFFPQATRAAVASGEAFPDGLGGGAFAGTLEMPLLLSRQAQLPTPVSNHLSGGSWNELYMMGGEAALSAQVEASLAGFVSEGD